MQVFRVRAEALHRPGSWATAYVVADDPDEAVLLLRKDIDFSGYQLAPEQLTAVSASADEVRRALGRAAAHEKGVYAMARHDPVDPAMPPP